MSLTTITQAVRNRFDELFIDAPVIPVAWDNAVFDSTGVERWARISILPNTTSVVSFGQDPCYREFGLISVQIFAPKDEGTFEAYRIADLIIEIFKFKTFDGVVTGAPETARVGLKDDDTGNWFQVNVFFEYYFTTN